MKAWEIIGYTYDGAMYHEGCEPKGPFEGDEPQPIFASDEINDDDTCDHCLHTWIADSHAGKSETFHAPAHVYMSGERPAYFSVSEDDISSMVDSYLETLVWSSTLMPPEGAEEIEIEGDTYRDGTPLDQIPGCDSSDLPEKIREESRDDCADFLEWAQIECRRTFDSGEISDLGHNFALSRNGHGAGFFDTASTCVEDRDGESHARDFQNEARRAGDHDLMPWVENGKVVW